MRIANIGEHPASVGFPPNHPPMHSLLTVPIVSKGKTIGTLYLTDKLAPDAAGRATYREFSEQDQEILERFATQAAIAIENAQLYRKSEQLAILQERERFSRDLHDGIIQSLYAIGLMLEDGQHRLTTEPETVSSRIDQMIYSLNEVMQDIRTYISGIHSEDFLQRGLEENLEELARGLRANSFMKVGVEISGDIDSIPPDMGVELFHIVREALTNAHKHARATRVDVSLRCQDQALTLVVQDNGIGIDHGLAAGGTGSGLDNMRKRAQGIKGDLHIEGVSPHGTAIRLSIP